MVNSNAPFDLAIAYWSFGSLASDQLPGVAVRAMEEGLDSPALVDVACASFGADPDLHATFERALQGLGKRRLSKEEAGHIIVRDLASRIARGELAPIEGAREIWKLTLECAPLIRDYGIFAGRASEYEDLPSLRHQISDEIVREALAIVRGE